MDHNEAPSIYRLLPLLSFCQKDPYYNSTLPTFLKTTRMLFDHAKLKWKNKVRKCRFITLMTIKPSVKHGKHWIKKLLSQVSLSPAGCKQFQKLLHISRQKVIIKKRALLTRPHTLSHTNPQKLSGVALYSLERRPVLMAVKCQVRGQKGTLSPSPSLALLYSQELLLKFRPG